MAIRFINIHDGQLRFLNNNNINDLIVLPLCYLLKIRQHLLL
jgi:hypothetical protein